MCVNILYTSSHYKTLLLPFLAKLKIKRVDTHFPNQRRIEKETSVSPLSVGALFRSFWRDFITKKCNRERWVVMIWYWRQLRTVNERI